MYSGGDTTQFQQLLDGWAAGDEVARCRLLESAGQRLMKLTRRMLSNYPHLRRWEQTDDVFQNAVLAALSIARRGAARFGPRDSSAWRRRKFAAR